MSDTSKTFCPSCTQASLDVEIDVHLRLRTKLAIYLGRAGNLEREILHILDVDHERRCGGLGARLRVSCRLGH